MGPRASQDLRSPSPIMAPAGTCIVCINPQPHPYVQVVLRALSSGINMQIAHWKSTTWTRNSHIE